MRAFETEKTEVAEIDRSVYDIKDKVNAAFEVNSGLTAEIVEQISKEKHDPDWMREFRLKALDIYNKASIPNWGPSLEGLDMRNIVTYVRPNTEMRGKWSEVPDDIKNTFERLGIPQVVRSMFVRIGMLWVNANANSFGLVVSATNSVGNKLQKFLEVFVQGIDTASASMVGQNLGAKKIDRAGKTTLCTYIAATCCATVSSALCLLIPHEIFRLFTTDEAVIELGATFLRIFILHFFASALTGSFQAMVTGCGFVELGFILGLLDGILCKIGFSMLFMNVFRMGYIGLWWGVACSRILPGCICVGYYLSGRWKTRRLLADE